MSFDDPAVVGVFRDYQRWYLPLLASRYRACEALWHDAVRAAGNLLVFEAASDAEAAWLARQDPWQRLGDGMLVRCPPGVFTRSAPPPGPGTQRSGHFLCGDPASAPEPLVPPRA